MCASRRFWQTREPFRQGRGTHKALGSWSSSATRSEPITLALAERSPEHRRPPTTSRPTRLPRVTPTPSGGAEATTRSLVRGTFGDISLGTSWFQVKRAEKGPALLGVSRRDSGEFRAHRPLKPRPDWHIADRVPRWPGTHGLQLTGDDRYSIAEINRHRPRQRVVVETAQRSLEALCRLDSRAELNYYLGGGILPEVMRGIVGGPPRDLIGERIAAGE